MPNPRGAEDGETNLDFDLTLSAGLVAVGTVTPTLNEVSRSGTTGELYVSCECGFLGECEVGPWVQGRGSSA